MSPCYVVHPLDKGTGCVLMLALPAPVKFVWVGSMVSTAWELLLASLVLGTNDARISVNIYTMIWRGGGGSCGNYA